MTYLYLLVESLLLCGTIACLCMASGLDKLISLKPGEPAPPLSQRFSWRWLAAGTLCIVGFVVVLNSLLGPASSADALESARELTRETFREKLGKEPDSIDLQDVGARPYEGTARVGDEVWDVVVTRTAPQGARRTVTMECTLIRRER